MNLRISKQEWRIILLKYIYLLFDIQEFLEKPKLEKKARVLWYLQRKSLKAYMTERDMDVFDFTMKEIKQIADLDTALTIKDMTR